jgi:hypothetical protein
MFSSIITRIFEMLRRVNLNTKTVHGRRQLRGLFTCVAIQGDMPYHLTRNQKRV